MMCRTVLRALRPRAAALKEGRMALFVLTPQRIRLAVYFIAAYIALC